MRIIMLVKRKPERFGRIWGEYLIARSLTHAFRALGHKAEVLDYYDNNYVERARRADAVIHFDADLGLTNNAAGTATFWWTNVKYDAQKVLAHDVVVTSSPRMATSLGVHHMAHAADPDVYKITDPDEHYASEVLYIGGAMVKEPEREAQYLDALRKFNLAIYGHLWDCTPFRDIERGVISIEDACKAYCSTTVALNFHTGHQWENGFVTQRIFEALACGCTVVSDDSPEIRSIFGRRIRYSNGGDDLVEQVEEMIAKGRPTARTRDTRRRFILSDHTYTHRAREFLRIWGMESDV